MLQEKRQKLREAGLCLMVLIFADLVIFVSNVIARFFDGTFNNALNGVEDPSLVLPVQIALIVAAVLAVAFIAAQFLIGLKAYKVSRSDSAEKGYIVGAKVFFILSVLSLIVSVVTLFDPNSNGGALNTALSIASITLDVVIYAMVINAAENFRKAVLAG